MVVATVNDARDWIAELQVAAPARDSAIAELHALLLRGAYFELHRRRVAPGEIDDLATQAANDALVALLGKLGDFRGASRFTTWAYKFVLLEAGVKARRRAWQGREVVLADDAPDGQPSAHQRAEESETLRLVREAIRAQRRPHRRDVLGAVALG